MPSVAAEWVGSCVQVVFSALSLHNSGTLAGPARAAQFQDLLEEQIYLLNFAFRIANKT